MRVGRTEDIVYTWFELTIAAVLFLGTCDHLVFRCRGFDLYRKNLGTHWSYDLSH